MERNARFVRSVLDTVNYRVRQHHGLAENASLVSAGCGDFLVPELAWPGSRALRYAGDIARRHGPRGALAYEFESEAGGGPKRRDVLFDVGAAMIDSQGQHIG